ARFAEALFRAGRATEALALLREQRATAGPADPVVVALEIALLAETGDAAGLAAAFEREGESAAAADGEPGAGPAAAHALVRAAALREIVLCEALRAEALCRRALVLDPGCAAAVDLLEEKLRAGGRWAELAELLERDLGGQPAPPPARQRYLLETLVVLRRDRIGDLPAALATQRRLVALVPDDAAAWVALRDLELGVQVGGAPAGDDEARAPTGAATLIELASRAGGAAPAVAAALQTEAARVELETGDGEARQRAEK